MNRKRIQSRPRTAIRTVICTLVLLAIAHVPAPRAGTSLERTIFRARDKVFPSLVHIQPILEVYRSGQRGRMAVTGSGVIFSREGYVLTNNHVVERAERVTCTLSDRREISADVVGRDPETDVAVLKLDTSLLRGTLPIAELGHSADLQIGQYVMAMGSPLGLARSVSLGVISALDRYLPENQMPAGAATGQFNTWIQTDAAINPGNSGGPLVDLEGRVVGINARAVTVFGENVGFAIPIDLVREVADQIVQYGSPRRSWLGVNWQPLRDIADAAEEREMRGILVGGVSPGSPADRAGLLAGDVLVAWDGRALAVRYEEDLPPFRKMEAETPVGKEVDLSILREGRPLVLRAVTERRGTAEGEDFECREWGFTVRAINEEIARMANLDQAAGVIVTGARRDSFAAKANLRTGLVIESVEGLEIPDLQSFQEIYDRLVGSQKDRVLVISKNGTIRNYHLLKPDYDDDEITNRDAGFRSDTGGRQEPEEGGR